ncbi:MAG: hypothetical protein AB1646_18275 [Thermodesulfobacteriota bacterium]
MKSCCNIHPPLSPPIKGGGTLSPGGKGKGEKAFLAFAVPQVSVSVTATPLGACRTTKKAYYDLALPANELPGHYQGSARDVHSNKPRRGDRW